MPWLPLLFSGLLALSACDAQGPGKPGDQISDAGPQSVRVSELVPGSEGARTPPDGAGRPYEGNDYAINEGHRLFTTYNCNGCHFNGGGGMGPPLMDAKWMYGNSIEQIYASIEQGRPNGMPAWGQKLPPQQIWQLAAFVKSLSEKPMAMNLPRNQTPGTPVAPTSPSEARTPQPIVEVRH